MTTEIHFDEPHAGEWIQPVPRGYLLKCCDCGLVHRIDFRVVHNDKRRKYVRIQGSRYKAQFRVYRFEADQGSAKAQVPS